MTIGTTTAASTRVMSDPAARKTGVKKPVAARASQDVRIAKSTKPAAERSTALKADVAEQFEAKRP